MTDVTIKALASEIQTSVDRLIQQFADAGIRKSADDSVTAQEKQTLLTHLNREHGSAPDKADAAAQNAQHVKYSGYRWKE
ncbi:translation initiation factor 2 [Klebsiella michiganensis]|uniref:Translation initiation factor 2 n=1 Tax=Klebsiella michiganensis TaxID=1134687 RepID=A0A7H4M5F2_9ENTR|nr:translation initiation factor 2 [Klebsiella michiganensis]